MDWARIYPRIISILVFVFILSGCGTIRSQVYYRDPASDPFHDLRKPNVFVYGGTVNDCLYLPIMVRDTFSGGPQSAMGLLFGIPGLLVDIPLCIVADTLILPVTFRQQGKPQSPEARSVETANRGKP